MKNFIWIIIVLLIAVRYFSSRPVYKIGDSVRITGTVFSDPVTYPGTQTLKIAGLKISLPGFPEINYGDGVVIEGKVDKGKLKNAKLVSLNPSKGPASLLRKNIIDFYQRNLPQPASGLLGGIVLGSKGTLTPDFWNSVKNSGVAHVVVASGTNVTFVVSFFMTSLTLFIGRRKAVPFVILGIILYLFISGFDAPLIRAAVMSFLSFWAVETGRLVNGWRVLLLTAGLMLVIQPDWVNDIGFLLSFVSTGSIILLQPGIERGLSGGPNILKNILGVFRKDLSTTFAAQVGVTPILFVTFGQFNIWSPVSNLLVLWTIPLIMILGSIGGLMGLIWPFLGKMILWLSYPLLWWFAQIVQLFNS